MDMVRMQGLLWAEIKKICKLRFEKTFWKCLQRIRDFIKLAPGESWFVIRRFSRPLLLSPSLSHTHSLFLTSRQIHTHMCTHAHLFKGACLENHAERFSSLSLSLSYTHSLSKIVRPVKRVHALESMWRDLFLCVSMGKCQRN